LQYFQYNIIINIKKNNTKILVTPHRRPILHLGTNLSRLVM